LQKFGGVTFYDRTAVDQAALCAAGATILLTSKTPLPADVLAQLPKLRYIGVGPDTTM
jgi:glycerate dehydrogenase